MSIHRSLIAQDKTQIDKLTQDLRNISDPQKKYSNLISLSNLLKDNNPALALKYVQEASMISENKDQKALVFSLMADLYFTLSEYKLSIDYAGKANDMAVELGNKKILASSYTTLAHLYLNSGDFHHSSEYLYKCVKIYEESNSKKELARIWGDIGTLYFNQAEYEKALQYNQKSMAIMESIGDSSGMAKNYNNLAICYAELKKNEDYSKSIYKAIALNIKFGQRVWEGINYLNLGNYFKEISKFDSSLFYLNKSADIFKALGDNAHLSGTYLSLTTYYMKIGNLILGKKYAYLSYNFSKKSNNRLVEIKSIILIHQIYNELQDFKNAYFYSNLLQEVKDSLNLEESLVKLSQLEMQYQFEKNEQKAKLKEQRRDYIFIIILISLLMIIVIFILINNRQKLKGKHNQLVIQRLADEVNFKGKELTMNVMNLVKKNELLTEIGAKLNQIIELKEGVSIKDSIHILLKEIEHSVHSKILDEFEMRFVQVHGDFYTRLIHRFPDLTPNEMKLCAFLRLNMTSKDISELTGQQLRSIEIGRHRLRNKLGITNSQTNLISFLSKI